MNSKVDGSSTLNRSREIVLAGQDEELLLALERYSSSRGWTTTRVDDPGSAVLVCKNAAPSVCLVEGALDDFDTIAVFISLHALRNPPRVVAYVDAVDASTMSLAKDAFGVDEILVKPCDLATIADCLMNGPPQRTISGATDVEAPKVAAAVAQAVGGGA